MQEAFAYCEKLVRVADKDRFVATLFAPAERRGALFALYAFNIEVARVREVAREPLAGEIRLQWWSEVLAGEGRGEVEAHPVAAALCTAAARYGLSGQRLEALLEARRFDLYDEPMATLSELDAYADGASCGLIALAAQVLGVDRSAPADALARHAGVGYAIAGLLRAFPIHVARGQHYIPRDILQRHGAAARPPARGPATPQLRAALAELRLVARRRLDAARALIADAPPALLPALLAVAPVVATLARMERPDYDPYAPVDIAPWRRQWLIWRAARRPARLFG
jgi:phytoene synthase